MHGWEHPRHAIKKFESAFSWVHGADTDVLINSHYIHACSLIGIGLMSYGLYFASSKSFKYLYYIVINCSCSWLWKVQEHDMFCMPSVEEKHYLGTCWMAFDEETLALCSLGSISADEGSISAVQLLVVHFNDHTNSAEEVNEAGKQRFTWKGRAMVTFISPTQAALQNKRAVGWSCLFISVPSLTHWSHQIVQTLTYCSNCTSNLHAHVHVPVHCW